MIIFASLTYQGALLAEKVNSEFEKSELFLNKRIAERFENKYESFDKIQEVIGQNWNNTEAFVFVMAAGIVVRSIAPFVKDKTTDPAVLIIDEKGKNVISLLSGHQGGANELTLKIADFLNANPVITTASDVNQLPAFDDLARKNNFTIKNPEKLRDIAVKILEQEEIRINSSVNIKIELPSNIVFSKDDPEIIISEKKSDTMNALKLIPKNIVVGIGCRKDTDFEIVKSVFEEVLEKESIEKSAVSKIATISLKADEPGILQLAKFLGVEIEIISLDKIKEIENQFEGSSFVESVTGVKAVAEPSAFLTAKNPLIISKRYAKNGVTTALVKDESIGMERL